MAALSSIAAFLVLTAAAGPVPSTADTLLTELQSIGTFQRAFRLTISPQGGIYVADSDRNQVLLLSDEGSPASVGGYGWEVSMFDKPTGLATDGLNLFVSDQGNHRIQRFDRSLNFVSSFTTRDTSFAAARIGYPAGVALSRGGELFVLDGENLRVVKFTSAMRFERSFGDFDDQRARLHRPLKILVGKDDHVYVLEPERLLEFDMFGHYIRAIGKDVIQEAKSFALTETGFIVLTEDALHWFSDRGDRVSTVRAQHLMTEQTVGPLEDVVVMGDRLFLLTSSRIHVFRVFTGNR